MESQQTPRVLQVIATHCSIDLVEVPGQSFWIAADVLQTDLIWYVV